jgi:AcrR family transcriptional regulator
MRVNQATRQATEERLLDSGAKLFDERGFEAATTRELAARSGVAVGTLFNYFPTKEALAHSLLMRAAGRAADELEAARASRPPLLDGERPPLEETLFGHVAAELRHFAPYRRWIGEALRATGGPLRQGGGEGEELSVAHLERVERWLSEAGDTSERAITLHLYWSLYLGVLHFWSRDDSEHQGATLALLDRSIRLFCSSLASSQAKE